MGKKKEKIELEKYRVEYGTGETEILEVEKFSDAMAQAMDKAKKLGTSMMVESL